MICLNSLEAISKEIKIGLITSNKEIIISSDEKSILINTLTNKEITKLKKYEQLVIKNINGHINIKQKSEHTSLGSFTGPVSLMPENKTGLVMCNKSWYRGSLLVTTNKDKENITIVNNVDLEDYLFSVVPSEIPSSWQMEALKAQSVAARSYALGYLGRRKNKGYDLESTVEDQVYRGVSSEKKSTSQAVKETKGSILTEKNNKPLIALYHSSGGGYTDSIENLWDTNGIKPMNSIQPRPDYDDNSPHFKWHRTFNLAELNSMLKSSNIGEIKEITLLSRSIANRIMWLKITGTTGDTLMRGEEFRKCLKLPSSKFNFTIEDGYIKFAGRGNGHGLGLSQWGAKNLAENSFSYKEILAHYYPGANLVNLSELKK